jgi:hypothetical protein
MVCVRVKTCGCSRRNFIEVVLGTPADPLDGVFQQWDLRAGKLSVSGLSVPLRSATKIIRVEMHWERHLPLATGFERSYLRRIRIRSV